MTQERWLIEEKDNFFSNLKRVSVYYVNIAFFNKALIFIYGAFITTFSDRV